MSLSHPRRILVTTDFTDASRFAFPYAEGLARRYGAVVEVLHVVPRDWDYLAPTIESPIHTSHVEELEAQARLRLEALDLGFDDDIEVHRVLTSGASAAAGVVDHVRENPVDLIVMASHGRRLLGQLFLGSVARGVISAATCPVLCVKRDQEGLLDAEGAVSVGRILVPTDLSDESMEAIQSAVLLARDHGSAIDLLHVLQVEVPPVFYASGMTAFQIDADLRPRVVNRIESFADKVEHEGIKVHGHVEHGSPSREIARFADQQKVDLIVLSRRGAHHSPHLLGGTVERLLHDAQRPILVV
jgi:nucleotide-binding universal stress UspA family protein